MNTSKEKAIFTEGEYVVANYSANGLKRGMIGMIDTIWAAENNDQYVEVVVPYTTGNGKALRKVVSTWCKFLEHLPDEAMDCMDIQTINTNLMYSRGPYTEYYWREKIIEEAPLHRLMDELHRRKVINKLEPVKIIFNAPATIVFWNDDTKTVVKCSKGQEFSEYYGYLAAMAKKMYGTNGTINRLIRDKREYGDQHFNPEPIEKVLPSKKPSVDLSVDFEELKRLEIATNKASLSIDEDTDRDNFILRYDHDPKIGFDIEFNKRRKANEFYTIVEWSIKSGVPYTLEKLLNKKNEDGIETAMFRDYGWDSMDGILVRKLAPDRWKVIFPPAKFLGKH